MSSSAYQTLRQAVLSRQQIICDYSNHQREVCPHTLGHKAGREKVLAWQFGGSSSSGLPPGGEWRCLFVDEISNVSARSGAWHTGGQHTQPQTCVDNIDVEVT